MDSGAKGRRQPDIAGNHQGKAASPANPSQVLPKRIATRFAVVPQHDPGQAARQTRRRRAGVG
jgi:hypothetical protein